MGYELQAVIADGGLLAEVTRELPGAVLVPLGYGRLTLLPITDEFFDSVTDGSTSGALGLTRIPGGFTSVLANWSRSGPVAYVEADFFGGVGSQGAAVWADGKLVEGPLHVAENEPFGFRSPISQALLYLGVVARTGEDEFATIGLGRHRRIEDWAN
jgi:hypothetical protein